MSFSCSYSVFTVLYPHVSVITVLPSLPIMTVGESVGGVANELVQDISGSASAPKLSEMHFCV